MSPASTAVKAIPPADNALIESVIRYLPGSSQEDARQLFQSQQLGNAPGQSAANIATPPPPSLAVTGGNGVFNVTVTPPSLSPPANLWYRISYSPVKGFTSGVTTLEPSTATSLVLNLPGETLFFRVEASYNKTVWSTPVLASNTAAQSGLVSSAATADAASFNQTNLGIVTSTAVGSAVAAQIQGAGGSLTSLVGIKGSVEKVLPPATIVGVTPGATLYAAWNGENYSIEPTLAAVLADGMTPIGKFSAVTTAPPSLPTINPIISGGFIIGYDITYGGTGLTGPVTLTFGSVGSGAGAVPGPQTIVAGSLVSIAPGNPGNGGYSGGTTVTASGGVGTGTPGGGTAQGTTNGRLTT